MDSRIEVRREESAMCDSHRSYNRKLTQVTLDEEAPEPHSKAVEGRRNPEGVAGVETPRAELEGRGNGSLEVDRRRSLDEPCEILHSGLVVQLSVYVVHLYHDDVRQQKAAQGSFVEAEGMGSPGRKVDIR